MKNLIPKIQLFYRVITCTALFAITSSSGVMAKEAVLEDSLGQPETRTSISDDFEDQLLYHRAFEAVLWALPAANTLVMRQAAIDLDIGEEALFITKDKPTGKSRYVTYNASAPYVFGTFSTKEAPLVMEIPPVMATEKYSGSIFDLWFLPLADIGPLGDDEGKGVKYIILPPDWKGEIPAGFTPLHSKTYHVHMLFRALSDQEGDAGWEAGYRYAQHLKVYKYQEKGEINPFTFHDSSQGRFEGVPAFDLSYYQYIDQLVQEEPVLERDKVMMGTLAQIGFKKGQEYKPEAKTSKIFEQAVRDAQSWLIKKMESNDAFGRQFWPTRTYRMLSFTPDVIEGGAQWNFSDRLDYAARAYGWYYYGVGIQKKVGAAATYLTATQDANGDVLDGSKLYKIVLPPNVPITDFWEVIGYSTWTRSYIDTAANHINVNSKQDIKVNSDGSVDIFVGPEAPAGWETNWISTRLDEGFFIGLRFYGPTKALYDLEWTPSDPTPVE